MTAFSDPQPVSSVSLQGVNETAIRALVRRNWVFWLYGIPRLRWLALFVIPPGIIVAGALISGLLGVFDTFIRNPLAYTGALGTFTALSAYFWLAATLPKVLVSLYPAFDFSDERAEQNFLAVIRKNADLVNNPIVLLVVGVVIGLMFLNILLDQWAGAGQSSDWLGSAWVRSDQAVFFALYHGTFSVIGSAVLLGTGLIGLIGTLRLVYGVFQQPIRLAFYRRLSHVSDICIGIAFWTLLAFIAVIFTVSSAPATGNDQLSRVLLTVLASSAVVSIISLPLLFARNAIIREKQRQVGYFEQYCHLLTIQIAEAARDDPARLEGLQKTRADVLKEIEAIEAIPEWPVTALRAIQLISVSPLIGVLNFAIPLVEPLLQSLQSQFIDLFR